LRSYSSFQLGEFRKIFRRVLGEFN